MIRDCSSQTDHGPRAHRWDRGYCKDEGRPLLPLLDELCPRAPRQPYPGQTDPGIDDIKKAISALPDSSNVKDALQAAVAEAGDDLARLRNGVASWFDDAMNRVSGVYKRRIHWICCRPLDRCCAQCGFCARGTHALERFQPPQRAFASGLTYCSVRPRRGKARRLDGGACHSRSATAWADSAVSTGLGQQRGEARRQLVCQPKWMAPS